MMTRFAVPKRVRGVFLIVLTTNLAEYESELLSALHLAQIDDGAHAPHGSCQADDNAGHHIDGAQW